MAYFVEIQKYSSKYIYTVLGIMGFLPLFQAYGIIFVSHSVFMLQFLFLSLLFILGMFFFLSFFELKTVIKKEGIYVKFLPIHIRNFFYDWKDIEDLEIVSYKPFRDYWGWGYRPQLFGREKAMTIGGYYGMRITFKNGETVLVGTQRPDDLTYLISIFRDTNLLKSTTNII